MVQVQDTAEQAHSRIGDLSEQAQGKADALGDEGSKQAKVRSLQPVP